MGSVTQSSQEPFAMELALALEHIDTLTRDECRTLLWVLNETECEPLFAFLALHVKLSYVLASPHGDAFCSRLRGWGANAAIDAKIWQHWQYRPRYRPARNARAKVVDYLLEHIGGDLLLGTRPTCIEQALRNERASVLKGNVRAGDTIRYRYSHWDAGRYVVREVEGFSGRGSLYCHAPGKKTRQTLTTRDFEDPRFQFEIVSRATEEKAVEEPSVSVGGEA